jgi:hypothetical protein
MSSTRHKSWFGVATTDMFITSEHRPPGFGGCSQTVSTLGGTTGVDPNGTSRRLDARFACNNQAQRRLSERLFSVVRLLPGGGLPLAFGGGADAGLAHKLETRVVDDLFHQLVPRRRRNVALGAYPQ